MQNSLDRLTDKPRGIGLDEVARPYQGESISMRVEPVDHPCNARGITRLDDVTRRIAEPKITPVRASAFAKIDARAIRSSPGSADAPKSREPAGDEGKVPGVIRLLEAGHFKGVADVRLRINFFEQLSARAQAAAVPVVERESAELLAAVNAKVDELMTALAANDETQDAVTRSTEEFTASVQAAVERATSGEAFRTDALTAAIQAAFEVLRERLTELLAVMFTEPELPAGRDVTPPDPVVNRSGLSAGNTKADRSAAGELIDDRFRSRGTTQTTRRSDADPIQPVGPQDIPDDVPNDPGLTLDEAIALLTNAFQEALSVLLASIDQAVGLPDPSPPSGNGVAYDKFLETYNNLRGLTPALDERA